MFAAFLLSIAAYPPDMIAYAFQATIILGAAFISVMTYYLVCIRNHIEREENGREIGLIEKLDIVILTLGGFMSLPILQSKLNAYIANETMRQKLHHR